MAETKTNTSLKKYSEKLEKNLYSVDYEVESSNGNKFPSNRVKVDLINYDWEIEIKWEIRPYSWQKIVITNSKLELEDWNAVIKSKSVNWKAIKDETKIKISPDEFQDILKHFTKKAETPKKLHNN